MSKILFITPKLKKILTFIDKKRGKKLNNIAGLVAQLRAAIRERSAVAVYYLSQFGERFLWFLKKIGILYGFFVVPSLIFKSLLRFNYSPIFMTRVAVILLKQPDGLQYALRDIKIISTPGRNVYVTYVALKREFPASGISITCVLSTNLGLLTHFDALKLQIGGLIICIIR